MIDENKTAMNDTPPEPNGHANGTATTATAESAPKEAPSSSSSKKKKKKKKVHQHNQKPTTAQVDATAAPTAEQPSTETAAPIVPDASVAPTEESTAAPITDAAMPIADTTAAPTTDAAVPIAGTAAAPIAAPAESLRLRLKVWTDPATAKRYLIPSAFMRDIVNGQPVSDVMYAYVMNDDDTKLITFKASEWNALPFFYFQEDGPAPRATKRPVDVIST